MSEHSKRNLASLISAGAFIPLGIYALWETRGMSPLGSVFPRTIASAMIVFSVIYIVWRWFKPHSDDQAPPGSTPRRLLLVGIMVIWAVSLKHVGFLVTSVVAALLLLLVANYDRWTAERIAGCVLGTLLVVGGLYSVFALGLKVPLPAGILL